ncbi:putative membrane lipoprotein [Vibrio phage 249E41-1]|nr:putative membrane lipoprotein [Vibrio phage 249E41-1]CAH9017461.1 putative membrane lipoprotein [Vibrio phage 193E37-1]
MKKLFIILGIVAIAGCTDAARGKLSAYGGSASIKCYSADVVIFDGESTGKVTSEANSDGYYFVDKSDGKLKEVSGSCVIQYNTY